MADDLSPRTVPYREAHYAPRALEVERRANGEIVLRNPRSFATGFAITTDALDHWAQAAPDRIWLAERAGEGWRTVSFAQGREQVARIAGGLRELGLTGERPLLILAHNGIDHALVAFAAMGQGTAVAPVSPQYGLRGAIPERLAHAVSICNPAAVYVEDTALFADGLANPALAGLPVIAGRGARPGDIPLERLLDAVPARPTARPLDHAKYLLTSGSTGQPKAVIMTHAGVVANADQMAACVHDPEPPVLLHSAPWSHSMGANSILQGYLHRGGSLYIDGGQPTAARFAETVRNLRAVPVTFLSMVPAGWMLLADVLEADEDLARHLFATVKIIQYGGATLGQSVVDRIQAVAARVAGVRITLGAGFGSTETGPAATTVHWLNDRAGVVGAPLPGTSIRLVPQDGKLECRVKGPQVSPGYLGRLDLTAEAFDEEGYYRLGDAVKLADPDDPAQGMVFDGRLAENFKLTSGVFVAAGELRLGAISAVGSAVTDAVVCGEGRPGVGLLLYPNPTLSRAVVEAAVRDGLAQFNAQAHGAGRRVRRALVLPGPPDAARGEVTDKGYIAQSLARSLRAEALQRLFADPVPDGVMAFD
jgi:feruloyl-CoA synthase